MQEGNSKGARGERVLLALSDMFTGMETYSAPMRLAASIQTICSMQCGISKITRSPHATRTPPRRFVGATAAVRWTGTPPLAHPAAPCAR